MATDQTRVRMLRANDGYSVCTTASVYPFSTSFSLSLPVKDRPLERPSWGSAGEYLVTGDERLISVIKHW